MLAADPSGGAADALYRTSLPARVLADLAEAPHKALTQVGYCALLLAVLGVNSRCFYDLQAALSWLAYCPCCLPTAPQPFPPHSTLPCLQPPPRGQALMLVVEGQLTLLLRLALTGPPAQRAAAAQRLFALHALPRLSQCRALDLQPEEPGFGQYSGEAGRYSGATRHWGQLLCSWACWRQCLIFLAMLLSHRPLPAFPN